MRMSHTKVDSKVIESDEGVWQGELPELGDIRVKVRGLNNTEYTNKFEAMIRALPPSKRINGVVKKKDRDFMIGMCMLEHVLLDWDNVEEGHLDGKVVVCLGAPDAAGKVDVKGEDGIVKNVAYDALTFAHVPYAKWLAKIYLTDPDWQKFHAGTFTGASRVGEMIEVEDKVTEKNSGRPSSTP